MTTRTMRLASGFLDSLSASETVAFDVKRSRTDRPASVYSFVCASTVEDRLGIPRICAHSGRTTCSELAQKLYTQRDSKTNIPRRTSTGLPVGSPTNRSSGPRAAGWLRIQRRRS